MAKIMLVEDDDNLREIYGARLLAEGHDIVAAKDGEEALALAVKEKPELIISDVMMPRISGFDMLDILRNAPETKNTKVIMMTALSQAEDKSRADKLGADRYLVKSQVTLEDVTNVVKDVLEGTPEGGAPADAVPEAEEVPEAPAEPEADNTVAEILGKAPEPAAAPAEPAPVADAAPAPAAPAAEEVPAPEATADAPAPAQEPEEVPAPETGAPTPEPTPEAVPVPAPTVDAIANPVVEVHDDDTSKVVAPPEAKEAEEGTQALDSVASILANTPPAVASSSTSDPLSSVDPTVAASTPLPATDPAAADDAAAAPVPAASDDLPPVVAPAEPVAPIKVELPTPPGDEPAAPAADAAPAAPVVEAPADVEVPTEDSVLAILAAEDAGTPNNNSEEELAAAALTPPVPAIVNGAPATTVVEPTQPPPEPEAPAVIENPSTYVKPDPPESDDPDATTIIGTDGTTGKKVINPINDPTATPDINALLAAEDAKSAVENIPASTVITPATVTDATAVDAAPSAAPAGADANGVVPAPPAASGPTDELSKIAL